MGVIPPYSGISPYFVAIQAGLSSALVTCLMINGFVGFQLYEDGTTLSLLLLRSLTLLFFIINFVMAISTFKSIAGLSPSNTIGLFVVLYLINAIFLAVYVVSQIVLVLNTLEDLWPLGSIIFGVGAFILGQVLLYVAGQLICEGAQHYLDGLFFATLGNLFAVMMIYKYWDSITKEDLEFSVGLERSGWEAREPLVAESEKDDRGTMYGGTTRSDHPQSQKKHWSGSRTDGLL